MPFTLVYLKKVVEEDIPLLGVEIKRRVKSAIEKKLLAAPDLFGIPLRYPLAGIRKLRVGDYRIVFVLEDSTVTIVAILHRNQVYTETPKRL